MLSSQAHGCVWWCVMSIPALDHMGMFGSMWCPFKHWTTQVCLVVSADGLFWSQCCIHSQSLGHSTRNSLALISVILSYALSQQETGFWFIFHHVPTGPSVGMYSPGYSEHIPLGKFHNNRAHSNYRVSLSMLGCYGQPVHSPAPTCK